MRDNLLRHTSSKVSSLKMEILYLYRSFFRFLDAIKLQMNAQK